MCFCRAKFIASCELTMGQTLKNHLKTSRGRIGLDSVQVHQMAPRALSKSCLPKYIIASKYRNNII